MAVRLVSVSGASGTRHAQMPAANTVTVPVTPAAATLMVTAQELYLDPSDPAGHNVKTVARSWVKAPHPVASVVVTWKDGNVQVGHPHAQLRCCTDEVAAANVAARADLKKQHAAIRAKYGSGVLQHGLIKPLYMLTAAEPQGEPPSLHAGAVLLGGIQGSPGMLRRVFDEACTYAEGSLGEVPEGGDARPHVCLALASLRGMYQTEDRDDRAFSWGVGQDCDDEALMLGGFANAFTRQLQPTAEWTGRPRSPTQAAVMRVLQGHTPTFAHVLAHPPHPLPDGTDECGHVVCIMTRGFGPDGRLVDPFVVEPTAPSVPPGLALRSGAVSKQLCREITPADYRRIYFVATEDCVRYFFTRCRGGGHVDGVNANWALGMASQPPGDEGYVGVEARLPAGTARCGDEIHQFLHVDDAVRLSRAVLWGGDQPGRGRRVYLEGKLTAWDPLACGVMSPFMGTPPPPTQSRPQ